MNVLIVEAYDESGPSTGFMDSEDHNYIGVWVDGVQAYADELSQEVMADNPFEEIIRFAEGLAESTNGEVQRISFSTAKDDPIGQHFQSTAAIGEFTLYGVDHTVIINAYEASQSESKGPR